MNANQLVDHFILSCSHDLRAPVSSIKGLVKVAEYFPHHDEIHKCFEKINECTDKMDKLIHSLEEFMVISHYTPVPTETDCEQFANDILENFQEELVAKNIIVKKEVRVTKPWFIDRYTFSLILKHLLSNAIAFQDNRKKKKCIAVKISTKKKFTLLEVSDNGMGIPTEFQQKIFQLTQDVRRVVGGDRRAVPQVVASLHRWLTEQQRSRGSSRRRWCSSPRGSSPLGAAPVPTAPAPH